MLTIVTAVLVVVLAGVGFYGFVSREVSPVAVTVAVLVALAALLLLASFGPAREARRTQPAPLLREE